MMTKCFSLHRWLVCGVILLLSIIPLSAQDIPIPYVYYYSQTEQAFIVQRADRTDQSVLVDFEPPERQPRIIGAGWSPSGNWFTWMTEGGGGGTGPNNVYLVARDGGNLTTVFNEQVAIVLEAEWSPTHDLLLIRYGESSDNILVYDPVKQQAVFEMRGLELNPVTLTTMFTVQWSPDGSMLAIAEWTSQRLFLVDQSNFEIERSLPASTSPPSSSAVPQWFSTTLLAYLASEQNELILEDISSGHRTTVALPEEDILYIYPSPDGAYALVYTYRPYQPNQAPSASTGYTLWLLSINESFLTLLEDDIVVRLYSEAPVRHSYWSSNGLAYFVNADHQISVVDPVTHSTTLIEPTLHGALLHDQAIWTINNTLVFSLYLLDGLEASDTHTYEYDPLEAKLRLIEPQASNDSGSGNILQISPLGYYAYRTFIHQPDTRERFPLSIISSDPKYGSVVAIEDVRWHPAEAWLFLISWQLDGVYLINLVNLDSTVQIELGLCPPDSQACFGWLPPKSED